LESHKLQGLLQPLQEWVIWVTVVLLFCCHSFHLKVSKQQVSCLETEEHRQCLSSSNEEKAGTNDHHDLLLQILLIARNILIINTNWNDKMTKETN
jgi:Mg2+/Co2+ transporter CorB